MILSAQSIRARRPLAPLLEAGKAHGLSFGLSGASYDVRIAESVLMPPGAFVLASTMERFTMPSDLAASVRDKSTWARRGLAVQNTWIDPGWTGYLTLELSNHWQPSRFPWWAPWRWDAWFDERERRTFDIKAGMPIAQIVFELLDQPTEQPYHGKYQQQEIGPQEPRLSAFDGEEV